MAQVNSLSQAYRSTGHGNKALSHRIMQNLMVGMKLSIALPTWLRISDQN